MNVFEIGIQNSLQEKMSLFLGSGTLPSHEECLPFTSDVPVDSLSDTAA